MVEDPNLDMDLDEEEQPIIIELNNNEPFVTFTENEFFIANVEPQLISDPDFIDDMHFLFDLLHNIIDFHTLKY